jgi:hypothetical protein
MRSALTPAALVDEVAIAICGTVSAPHETGFDKYWPHFRPTARAALAAAVRAAQIDSADLRDAAHGLASFEISEGWARIQRCAALVAALAEVADG